MGNMMGATMGATMGMAAAMENSMPPPGGMPNMGGGFGGPQGGMPNPNMGGFGGPPPQGMPNMGGGFGGPSAYGGGGGGGGGMPANAQAPASTAVTLGPEGIMATAHDLEHFLTDFKKASFSSDKVTFVKTICQNYVFDLDQVATLLKDFTFDKMEALEIFRNSIVNPGACNASTFADCFNFDSDKEEAAELVASFPTAEARQPFAHQIEDDGHRSEGEIQRFVASLKACSFSSDRVEAAATECRCHPNPPFDGPQLVRVLQTMPFADDAQTVLGCFLGPQIVYPMTCQEVLKVLEVFDHSSDKIAVLPSLKPFISDGQNKLEIVSSFTFSSDKEEAEEILRDVLVRFQPKVPPMTAIQEALKRVGRCPAGYAWRQVSGGWRCAAGGHYVDDAQLAAAM